MKHQRIAILGANDSIVPLINKAKKKGFETHVFAYKCDAPGEKIADYFYPISIAEKEKVLKKCVDIGIIGICSITSDFAAPVVNYIARHMGFLCNEEKSEILARNKYYMRTAFQEAGLFVPKYIEIDKYNDSILESLDVSYPLIVKPIDGWSSKGVSRVNNKTKLEESIKNAVEKSLSGKAIIEEYIDGQEYSAECISYKGNMHILAFTQKETTGYPHYIETGHFQPADISDDFTKIAYIEIDKALKSLGIINGASHVEFKIVNDRICIIEIGARMGGDCIGTHLTPMSTGIDYVGMVIDISIGKEPDFSQVFCRNKPYIKFILNRMDYEYYLQLKSNNKVVYDLIYDTNFDNEIFDSSSRHGYFIIDR